MNPGLFPHESVFPRFRTGPSLAVQDQIRIVPKLPNMVDHGRPATAKMGGNPIQVPFLDPPFTRQLGEIDAFLLPNRRISLRNAQFAWFE